MTIKTNNVPRYIIHGYELSDKERKEFNYYTLPQMEQAEFIRYKGQLYNLHEFNTLSQERVSEGWKGWDGVKADTYFSGLLVKFVEGNEQVVVGTYYEG